MLAFYQQVTTADIKFGYNNFAANDIRNHWRKLFVLNNMHYYGNCGLAIWKANHNANELVGSKSLRSLELELMQ